jgi:multisubunit Na+/H+ antiporter MnhC subunit
MEPLTVAVVFVAAVVGLAILGIRLGMLLAPRIDRFTEPHDEVDRADDE